MRVILSGGGTAGHINPAISIAKTILENEPDSKILFVGKKGGMEETLVPKEGFDIKTVEVEGFKRKLTLENIKTCILAVTSVNKAKKIIKEFSPDVVIGTGGYVSWPVLRAATKMHIPTLIHEQNAFPGLTTKKLSKYVDKVLLSFEETEKELNCGNKTVICGNPVNPEIGKISYSKARSRLGISAPFILSYGGSLGAKVINENIFELCKKYTAKSPVFHTHAFGKREYDFWKPKYDEENICKFGNVKICDYIFDMPVQLAAADIVIARSGAITLAELSYLGKPAILIPSPNVTNNHQYFNAKVFADAGAAILIKEDELTPEKLIDTVKKLVSNPEKLRIMSENMKKLAKPDACALIYNEVKKITKG